MLIAIAGPIGAGKSTVARAVSRRLGIPFHAIDDDKRAVGESHPEFSRWVAESIPFPDEFRSTVFDRALHRLTEAYLALGVSEEAQTAAALLGYNFPGSDWYIDSYSLLQSAQLQPEPSEDSWLSKRF